MKEPAPFQNVNRTKEFLYIVNLRKIFQIKSHKKGVREMKRNKKLYPWGLLFISLLFCFLGVLQSHQKWKGDIPQPS